MKRSLQKYYVAVTTCVVTVVVCMLVQHWIVVSNEVSDTTQPHNELMSKLDDYRLMVEILERELAELQLEHSKCGFGFVDEGGAAEVMN